LMLRTSLYLSKKDTIFPDKHTNMNLEHLTFKDLVDLDELKLLFENFSAATGIATNLTDHTTKEILLNSGGHDIYIKFHHTYPASHEHCNNSNRQLHSGVDHTGQINIHHCEDNLINGSSPILIEGKHFANLYMEQVHFNPPDTEQFGTQTRRYSYKERQSLERIANIPVASEEKFTAMLRFLTHMTSIIAETGLARHKISRASIEKEALLQSIFKSAPIGIGLVVDRVFQWTNEKMSEITGYTKEQLRGQKSRMLYMSNKEFKRVGLEAHAQIKASGTSFITSQLKRRDSSVIDVQLSSTPKDINDRTSGDIFTVLDTTELTKAFDIINRSTSIAFLWKNEAGWPVDFVSDNVLELTGYSSQELTSGEISYTYQILHPSDLKRVSLEIKEASKNINIEKFTHKPYRIITKDNKIKWISDSSRLKKDDTGRITHYQGIVEDITRQKKIEEELLQSQKMKAIGTLAGGIAHDFNNILSTIMGYSEVAKLSIPSSSPAVKDINEILKASKRAANLIKQILTFSRNSGSHRGPIAPHLVIKEALQMMRSSMPATVKIEQYFDKECGVIIADPTNLHQIIINLCTNALHALTDEKGTLSIGLRIKEISDDEIEGEPDVSPGQFVVLEVRDTGHGMDQATQKRIFDPYFTTKEVGKGTGLGLAVVHGIIKDYNGFIRVRSEVGKGTSFYVYIPASQQKVPTADKEETYEPLPTGNEHILIIDDESTIIDLKKVVLEQLGYKVTATTDSFNALDKIRSTPGRFDLIITDQTMPGLTGAELTREVLQIVPDMPIILCTGHSNIISEESAFAAGIKKYLQKPVDRTTLAQNIRQILDKN